MQRLGRRLVQSANVALFEPGQPFQLSGRALHIYGHDYDKTPIMIIMKIVFNFSENFSGGFVL